MHAGFPLSRRFRKKEAEEEDVDIDVEAIATKLAARRKEIAEQPIKAKATPFVIFACLVSGCSGLLFGFNIGISGGVSNMPRFQEDFFPDIYYSALKGTNTYYCKHNDSMLQLFASIMSFAAAIAAIPGSHVSKAFGRTMTMTIAGTSFVLGSIILAGAVSVSMLMLGRVFWGIGIGFGDQAATIYSSELAPPHLRGTLTMFFQLCTVSGIFFAQCLNIGTEFWRPYGWRVSLGAALIPGFVLLIGGLTLPETPNSLIERGYLQKGRAVLESIRGTSEVDAEYGTIIAAHRREMANRENQYTTLLRREFRPHLMMNIIVPAAQQWTGSNVVNFFSPFIFQSLGSQFEGESGSLGAAAIAGAVQVLGTIVGMLVVDKLGRRKTLIFSTVQIVLAEVALAVTLAVSVHSKSVTMTKLPAEATIAVVCYFIFTYAYGWGPMGWVISAESQPLETRCLGQGVTVMICSLSGAVVEQSFLNMLCNLEWGVYILFAACQSFALVFCIWFLPETTGIPIENVRDVFRVHWYWKRFFDSEEEEEGLKAEREIIELLKQRKRNNKEHHHRTNSGNHFHAIWRYGLDSEERHMHKSRSTSSSLIETERAPLSLDSQNESFVNDQDESDRTSKQTTLTDSLKSLRAMKSPFSTQSSHWQTE